MIIFDHDDDAVRLPSRLVVENNLSETSLCYCFLSLVPMISSSALLQMRKGNEEVRRIRGHHHCKEFFFTLLFQRIASPKNIILFFWFSFFNRVSLWWWCSRCCSSKRDLGWGSFDFLLPLLEGIIFEIGATILQRKGWQEGIFAHEVFWSLFLLNLFVENLL
jgi:hypothetical protein